MGANNSKSNNVDNNSNHNDNSLKLIDKINLITKNIFSENYDTLETLEHLSDFGNKPFCKRIKLYIRDEVLMKENINVLKKIEKPNTKYNIGIEVEQPDDQTEQQSSNKIKETICENIAYLLVKKINLIATIRYIILYCNTKLNNLRKGHQCYNNSERTVFSDISIQKNNDLDIIKEISYDNLSNKTEHSDIESADKYAGKTISLPNGNEGNNIYKLKFNKEAIRKLSLDKLYADNDWKGINWKSKKTTPTIVREKLNERYLLKELNESQCNNIDGVRWLTDTINNNIIPDKKDKPFYKKYMDIIDKSEAKISSESSKLLKLCESVVLEKVIDGNKVFKLESIDNEKLNKIINSTKKIMEDMISEIQKMDILLGYIQIKQTPEEKRIQELETELKKAKELVKNN